MHKSKLATLVAASFAGLMLSAPAFAQNTSGGSTSVQTTAPAAGAPESRSTERADKQAAESDASRNTGMKNQTGSNLPPKLGAPESRTSERADKQAEVSKEAAAAAKVDYDMAIQKCDAMPSGERGTCVQDAKDAQSLAMNKGRNGSPATSGAPESRSNESADKQSGLSKDATAAADAEYKAAVVKCDAQPAASRSTCVQEAKDAQSLAMNKARNGSAATSGAPQGRTVGPQSAK